MKKLFTAVLLVSTMALTGCGSWFSNFDQMDPSQQFLVKTTIQLATTTYLDKNSSKGSINTVIEVTDQVMLYMASQKASMSTTSELKSRLHDFIMSYSMSIQEKITLMALGDVILAEAVSWADIDVTSKITKEQANALFFCATTMNETAKMYLVEEI